MVTHFLDNDECIFLKDAKVIIIEHIIDEHFKSEKYLEHREGYWQAELFSIIPYGMNKRQEFEGGQRKRFYNS